MVIPALRKHTPYGQFRSGNGTNPTVREKVNAEESAAIRAQPIGEIGTLPEDDLQPRAIAILKAKNRLTADDAKLVENAFAARMAQQEPSEDALTAEEPVSGQASPISPQPLPAPPEAIKRPRDSRERSRLSLNHRLPLRSP